MVTRNTLNDVQKFAVYNHLSMNIDEMRRLTVDEAVEHIDEKLGINVSPVTLRKVFKAVGPGYLFKRSYRVNATLEKRIDELCAKIDELEAKIELLEGTLLQEEECA